MARGPRIDYPGAWHHVYNRGTARRTIIENHRDGRMFLSLLARQVRARTIEVHAYALMSTHFHLLVRSPGGSLPRAMQRIQDGYSRWFNRTRRRDGPLFRGRYGNRLVESDSHWFAVVPYIHENPVSAGLAARPEEYPFSSAGAYAASSGPLWLRRDVVEREFLRIGGAGPASRPSPSHRWLVERRLTGRRDGPAGDPLRELAGPTTDRVLQWMERKAHLADGTRPGWVMVAPETIRSVLTEESGSSAPPWTPSGTSAPASRDQLEAGMLRAFSGLSFEEVAQHLSIPIWKVKRLAAEHARSFHGSPGMRTTMARLLHLCIQRDHPGIGEVEGKLWTPPRTTTGHFAAGAPAGAHVPR